MNDHPIQVLFVGCGAFAHRYHVPALIEDETLSVAAIFDPSPSDKTRALAQRYRAPVVARLEDLPQPQVLAFALVTTPHTLHAGHVDAVLDRALHVLVDKPFVMKAGDARRLAERAQSRGLVNGVAYNRRFDAGCLRAREIVRSGGIGAVRFVQTVQLGYERAGWFLVPALGGGGPYTGRASHMADIVPWLIERAPVRLRSRVREGAHGRSDHGGFIELQFNGLECQMTCIEEGLHMWDEVRLFGDDGLIELRRPLTEPIGWTMTWLSGRGQRLEELPADAHPGDATRNFVAALRGNGRVACSFADAVPSVEIVERAFESARTGGAWLDLTQADHAQPREPRA
jgi:predicted dehydrogenase